MYDDVKLIVVIFLISLILFLHFAEKGVMEIMGVHFDPMIFDFKVEDSGKYIIEVLGENFVLTKNIKIFDITVENKNIVIKRGDKEYSFSPLIKVYEIESATEIFSRLIKKMSECIIKLTAAINHFK